MANLFGPEKRDALRGNEHTREYIQSSVLAQLDFALTRIGVEIDKIAEKDFNRFEEPRDITLYHRLLVDLQEQTEILDLQLQRVECTYVCVSLEESSMFRQYSKDVCLLHRRAAALRRRSDLSYRCLVQKKNRERGASCGDPFSLDYDRNMPLWSQFANQIQKIFSCTQPRKEVARKCTLDLLG